MNAPFRTQAGEGFERRGFTVAEIWRMQEQELFRPEERFELIEGEIIPMQSKRNKHEIVRGALMETLTVKLAGKPFRVRSEQSLYLSDRTFVEPDIFVYPRAMALPEDVRGSDTLLVIEVADSSRRYDAGLKAQIYAQYGVRHYWLVDAERSRDTLCFELAGGVYPPPRSANVNAPLALPFAPTITIVVADLD